MIECEYPGCDRLATSTRVNADGYLVASSPPTCREHEGSIAPTDDSAERLSTGEIVRRMRYWIDTHPDGQDLGFGHSATVSVLATIDGLTARVTELEGVLFTANEDKDEWRQSAEACERSAKERLERAAAAEHRIEELTAEREEAVKEAKGWLSNARGWSKKNGELHKKVVDLSAQVRIADDRLATAQHRYRGLEAAARECVDAAKDLRKYVSPDSGCGYFTYKRIWDSSMQAETHFVHALAALSDPAPTVNTAESQVAALSAQVEAYRGALTKIADGSQCWGCDEWGERCGAKPGDSLTSYVPCSISIAIDALAALSDKEEEK